MTNICICGRIGYHCPSCGSISKSPLMQQSIVATATFHDEIRCFRCRKCGMEYFLMGTEQQIAYSSSGVLKTDCMAPRADRPNMAPSVTEDAKALMNAVALIEKAGFMVTSKDAIKQVDSPKEEPKRVLTEEEKKIGWTINELGQKEAPISFEELIDRVTKKKDGE